MFTVENAPGDRLANDAAESWYKIDVRNNMPRTRIAVMTASRDRSTANLDEEKSLTHS